MRLSARIASIALAGSLALSAATAPLALASEGGLLQGLASSAAAEAATDEIVELQTQAFGVVTLQVPSAWGQTVEEGEGELYATFESETGLTEVMFVEESSAGMEDELFDEMMAAIEAQMEACERTSETVYYLDGAFVRTVSCTGVYEEIPLWGGLTIVYGADYTFAMMSLQFEGDNGYDPLFERMHATVGIAAAANPEPAAPAADPEPVAPPVETESSEPTDETQAPVVAVEGESFVCDGWTVVAGTDVVTTVIEDEWSDYNGMEVVGIPVTITNTTGTASNPWHELQVIYFGPDGVEVDTPGYELADSLQSMGSMRPDASVTCYLYFLNEGDGEYVAGFEGWEDESYNEVSFVVGSLPEVDPASLVTGGFVCDGWTIVAGDAPVFTVIDNEWSDWNGTEVVGIPVTLVNGTGEVMDPWIELYMVYYGPAGIEVESPGYELDDSIECVDQMRPGAVAEAYLYFVYEGDGEYAVAFEGWEDGSYNEIVMNVVK